MFFKQKKGYYLLLGEGSYFKILRDYFIGTLKILYYTKDKLADAPLEASYDTLMRGD